jgi:hypothetical protein
MNETEAVPFADRKLRYLFFANNARVTNVTRHFTLKHKQALRAVAECACAWVEYGVSIRDLTLAEATERRKERARWGESLAWAEQFGLTYEEALKLMANMYPGGNYR